MLEKRKRTRKSVARPRSGRRITRAQYDELATAYFAEQNISLAADKVGLSAKTATKYINDGDAVFPAIKSRFAKANAVAIQAQDAEFSEKRRFVLHKVDTMLDKMGDVLDKIEVLPSGKSVDGKIQISVSDLRIIISAFDDLQNLRDKLTGHTKEEDRSGATNVTQVNILDKDSVAAAARNFLGSELGAQIGQPMKEMGLRSALAKTANRRVANQVPIDVTPDEDDTDAG